MRRGTEPGGRRASSACARGDRGFDATDSAAALGRRFWTDRHRSLIAGKKRPSPSEDSMNSLATSMPAETAGPRGLLNRLADALTRLVSADLLALVARVGIGAVF